MHMHVGCASHLLPGADPHTWDRHMHSWQSYNPLLFCCPALVIPDGKLQATGQTALPSKCPARQRSTCCSIAQLRVTAIKSPVITRSADSLSVQEQVKEMKTAQRLGIRWHPSPSSPTVVRYSVLARITPCTRDVEYGTALHSRHESEGSG